MNRNLAEAPPPVANTREDVLALEAFAKESPPESRTPKAASPRRRVRPRPGWVLALIALIEAPPAALWLFQALAGPGDMVEGRLRVETEPPGIDVRVDGTERGQTPLVVPLAAGDHTVDVRHGDGWRSLPVTVAAGAESLQYLHLADAATSVAPPANATGSLTVVTDPAAATVLVDGVERGRSPLTIADLTPGEHQVLLQMAGGPHRRIVRVEAGATASLVVSVPPPGVVSGWVTFDTRVPLQIHEGERLIGTTEVDRIMLPVGRHELDLVSDVVGFRAQRTVTVREGETTTVSLDMPSGRLHINAQPWAEVWVDGELVGQTPIGNLSRTIGPHQIVFRHPQLGERRTTALVTLREPARVSVDLRQP